MTGGASAEIIQQKGAESRIGHNVSDRTTGANPCDVEVSSHHGTLDLGMFFVPTVSHVQFMHAPLYWNDPLYDPRSEPLRPPQGG